MRLQLRRVGGGGCHCGTIEVAGGSGCERGGGIVDEARFCFGFNLIVDCIVILLNELRFEGPVLPFLLNSAVVL